MGYKWEVYGYVYNGNRPAGAWATLYRGSSNTKALWAMFKNRKKYGCIKLELRW
jgi:hypothetical protein